MIFVDYVFETAGKNIVFDKELSPSSIDVQQDDLFRVVIDENNRIIFVKVEE